MKALTRKLRAHRRATTLIEMSIGIGIFGLIAISVSSAVLAAARHSYAELDVMQSEEKARYVLDTIRSRIVVAQTGTLAITNDGSQLDFFDPVRGQTSRFRFNSGDRTLDYWRDADSSVTRTFHGIQDVAFTNNPADTLLNFPTDGAGLLQVEVTIEPRTTLNDDRPVVAATLVHIRNKF